MWVVWLILCGVFLLIEIFTVSFLMFWPGIGAFLAFITSFCYFNYFNDYIYETAC